jgi:hypothetical protein
MPGLAGSAINDSGQVTGYGNNEKGDTQGFIGTASGSAALPFPVPPPPQGLVTYGYSINDSGEIAGQVIRLGPDPVPFIGTASAAALIPLPPGATRAIPPPPGSLNDSGVVVGISDVGGWIWDSAHGTRLLNDLAPAGYNILDAYSISDSGLILADGSYPGGTIAVFVLTPAAQSPIPEPATSLLVATGLLLLALNLGRKRWGAFRRTPE